jgi:transposase
VYRWLSRYERDGVTGLAGHSHRPRCQPRQLDAGIEALVCQLRGTHPRWGPRRLLFELGRAKVSPLPSRSTLYRVLVRHGLVPAPKRKRRRQNYKRWQREEPMQLWQVIDGETVGVVSRTTSHQIGRYKACATHPRRR